MLRLNVNTIVSVKIINIYLNNLYIISQGPLFIPCGQKAWRGGLSSQRIPSAHMRHLHEESLFNISNTFNRIYFCQGCGR